MNSFSCLLLQKEGTQVRWRFHGRQSAFDACVRWCVICVACFLVISGKMAWSSWQSEPLIINKADGILCLIFFVRFRKGTGNGSVCCSSQCQVVLSCFVFNLSSSRFCIAAMDMTLYPPSASYVKAAFQVLSSVTAMSPCHCGFIMQPVLQKQTTEVARIKHRRIIEDFLVKGNTWPEPAYILYFCSCCILTWLCWTNRCVPQVAPRALHHGNCQLVWPSM